MCVRALRIAVLCEVKKADRGNIRKPAAALERRRYKRSVKMAQSAVKVARTASHRTLFDHLVSER
jgi:hypothetical protein